MPDFSTIVQDPAIRAIVQENALERSFHDSLYPQLLFRTEASPEMWPANVGDSMIFTGVGLLKPKQKPLRPGTDPTPSDYSKEQWSATLQQYADTIDTPMPTSVVAVANMFLRNAHQLGLGAGQTLNRVVRNRIYNAALAGHTVADTAQSGVTTLRVKRLNGFTRARRPDLANGSPVRYDTVSGNNPLKIRLYDRTGAPAEVSRTVVGFTADTAGDEVGPGTLTLSGGAVTVNDRDYVVSEDRTYLVRVGGGMKVDDLGSTDILRLADIRSAVARFRTQNVPVMPDLRFHCHLDPTSESQVYADDEWQRLLTSLPDYYMYKDFAIGELLGCLFYRNSECPLVETVEPKDGVTYDQDDPFAGELTNNGLSTGMKVHRPVFVGQGGIIEYYQELSQLITEAGVVGRVGEPKINNNGIEVYADRVQLIIRAPLNRLQDQVSTSWKFIGDWPFRTDVTTGDVARMKRVCCIEHGE